MLRKTFVFIIWGDFELSSYKNFACFNVIVLLKLLYLQPFRSRNLSFFFVAVFVFSLIHCKFLVHTCRKVFFWRISNEMDICKWYCHSLLLKLLLILLDVFFFLFWERWERRWVILEYDRSWKCYKGFRMKTWEFYLNLWG